ncbi:MAG TPA: DM9 repeat-containing protein [Polyangiaceae bacterium]|nr:DM9 repeat-containing protein [Polyangiaceae bacterium]
MIRITSSTSAAEICLGAIRALAGLFAGALVCAGCSKPDEPFARVERTTAEADSNPGYVWFHRKPAQPLPGARYEAGFDVKAQFGLGVCRARHAGGVIPGRTYGQRCSIASDGKELMLDEFDVLIARAGALWHVQGSPSADTSSALLAGRDTAGKPLFSCVAVHVTGWLFKTHNGFQPGVYRNGECEFAFEGESVATDRFFLLATASPRKERAVSDGGAEPAELDAGARAETSPRDAATDSTAAQADATRPSVVEAGAASADAASPANADAAPPAEELAGMEPEPELPFPPAGPAVCIEGEVPCPCERYNGCSKVGLCICRL